MAKAIAGQPLYKRKPVLKENLVRDHGKTVFLSTHNMQEAEQLSDRIAIINNARIKACGTLSELRNIVAVQEEYVIEVKNFSKSVLDKVSGLEGVITLSNVPTKFTFSITLFKSVSYLWIEYN